MTYKPAVILVAFVVVFLSVIPLAAQAQTCPALVSQALDAASAACRNNTAPSQMCYGNVQIEAQLFDITQTFEAIGDIVPVTEIQRMELAPLDVVNGAWGVAVAKILARNVVGTIPGQPITLLLFGGSTLEETDISEDGVLNAFIFRGGVGQPNCDEAPDGLMIQTPAGQAELQFTINDVEVTVGSTVYLTADADADMTFALLEGNGTVTANGVTQTLQGGELVTVPMDENLQPADAPTQPEPFTVGEEGDIPGGVYDLAESLLIDEVPLPEALDANGQVSASIVGGAGGLIQPLDGTWNSSTPTLVFSDGCPSELSSMSGMFMSSISTGFTDTVAVTFPNPFNLEAFFAAFGTPIAGEFSNPELNVYGVSMEGGVAQFTYTFVSETQLDISGVLDLSNSGMACTVTFVMTASRIGD